MNHSIYLMLINYLRGAQLAPTGERLALPDEYEIDFLLVNEHLFGCDLSEMTDLVQICYRYPKHFFKDALTNWKLSDEQVIAKGIVPLPDEHENARISAKLEKMFGERLAGCDGFERVRPRNSFAPVWMFALTKTNYPRGVIVPIWKNRKIEGLKVYRHFQDRESFVVGEEIKKAA